jgi:hypothetical protein
MLFEGDVQFNVFLWKLTEITFLFSFNFQSYFFLFVKLIEHNQWNTYYNF